MTWISLCALETQEAPLESTKTIFYILKNCHIQRSSNIGQK